MRRSGALVWLTSFALLFASACGRGLNAGGESETENGGVAFIVFTVMLVAMVVVLWLIMGRED